MPIPVLLLAIDDRQEEAIEHRSQKFRTQANRSCAIPVNNVYYLSQDHRRETPVTILWGLSIGDDS